MGLVKRVVTVLPCFARPNLQVLVYWLRELTSDTAIGHAVHVSMGPVASGGLLSSCSLHSCHGVKSLSTLRVDFVPGVPGVPAALSVNDALKHSCLKAWRRRGVTPAQLQVPVLRGVCVGAARGAVNDQPRQEQ